MKNKLVEQAMATRKDYDIKDGDPVTNLCIAVVEQAAKDYRSAYKKLKMLNGNNYCKKEKAQCQKTMREIRAFFHSDYGDILTFGKGEYIFERLVNELLDDDLKY